MVFGDRLLEAVDPGADNRDHLLGFGLGEFSAPFGYVRDLVDPYGKFRSVVFGFDVPFVGETGSRVGDEFRGGPSQICKVSAPKARASKQFLPLSKESTPESGAPTARMRRGLLISMVGC